MMAEFHTAGAQKRYINLENMALSSPARVIRFAVGDEKPNVRLVQVDGNTGDATVCPPVFVESLCPIAPFQPLLLKYRV